MTSAQTLYQTDFDRWLKETANLLETVHKLSQSQTVLNFGAIPYRENEIMFSKASIEPLNLLGWNPEYTLEQGLMKTIAEYKEV